LGSNVVSVICTNCQNGSLNGDGHWLAYELRDPSSTLRSVYLQDLNYGTNEIISTAERLGLPSGASLDSFSPIVTGDGRFVVFLSRVLAPLSPTRLYVYDRVIDQVILLTPGTDGIGIISGSGAKLQLARDGRTLLFRSFAELVEGDYNDKADVFVLRLGSGDQDNDGLDDDWEMAYFGNLARDGSGDYDGDGKSDREEFLSGSDPTNRDSVLRVLTLSRGGGGTIVFWHANPGRSYRVERKNAVSDPSWSTVAGDVHFNGSTGHLLDSSQPSATLRFYRVVALP
jgi:hypothetical protein